MESTKSQNPNSKLTIEEVKHVAKLASLTLAPQEVEIFQKQLSQVLGYVEMLNQVDTSEVAPTSSSAGVENVFRDDKAGESLSQEEALSGAKNKEKGYFKVKAIFNEE